MIFVSPEFLLSHPFARKKTKGWGTEMVRKTRSES